MATESPADSSGSLTKEELAAIEDEDVLNKMVRGQTNISKIEILP